MAVIPTFSSYAQTPNLAQAYLGGQEIQVARERIAQQAAEAASRIALGRQQLQAEQVANEMEWSAKKDIAARQALQQAQQFEIQKAYQETQLGLSQRNLEQQDLSLKLKLAEVADEFAAQQEWNRDFPILTEEGIKAGKPRPIAEQDAARTLMLRRGRSGVATALNLPKERTYPIVTSIDVWDRPSTIEVTRDEALKAKASMSPEAVEANAPLWRILEVPTSITGTNAPAGRTNAITIIGRRRSQ